MHNEKVGDAIVGKSGGFATGDRVLKQRYQSVSG